MRTSGRASSEELSEQDVHEPVVVALKLNDDGVFPNSKLPLLLYREAIPPPELDPAALEQLFAAHGWQGSWRNGIYPYHHFHSTAHEVLGVYRGSARVQLGGEQGVTYEIHPGDVLIIPAGVAHKNLGASAGFGVVAAYPEDQDWDMNYGGAGERPRADENIARVAPPQMDPVYGADGPLLKSWPRHSPADVARTRR